jgi:hypothetical protein
MPACVREIERLLMDWPDDVRVACSGQSMDAGQLWWELGRRTGARGAAAILVRRLVADADDVVALPAASGWTRRMHPSCDWVVMRVQTIAGFLESLSRLAVKGLDASQSYPPDKARRAVSAAIKQVRLAQLERLDVSSLELGATAHAFARAQPIRQARLRSLRVEHNALRSSVSDVVRSLATPGTLRRLAIGDNDATLQHLMFLTKDLYLSGLQRLDLGPNAVTGSDVLDLFRASPPLQLSELGIAGVPGVEQVAGDLFAQSTLPALRRLRLHGSLRPRFLPALAKLGLLDRIEYLDLTGADFQEEDVESLLSIPKPQGLTVNLDERDLPPTLRVRAQQWLEGGVDRR